MSQTALSALLRANYAAIGLAAPDHVFSGAHDDIDVRPFVMLRYQGDQPAFVARGPMTTDLDIYVHDEPGSYDRINDALLVIRDVLSAAVHVSLPDLFPGEVLPGVDYDVLVQADWQSTSGDQYDPGYNTVCRYSGYRLVTRTP